MGQHPSRFGVFSAMNPNPTSPKCIPRPMRLKSRVTNGKVVFAVGGDGRSVWTRRWRDRMELHAISCADPNMSEGRISLIRRVSAIEVQLEWIEAKMSEGNLSADLMDLYNQLSGNLRRLIESANLLVRGSKDVTPTLRDYLDHVIDDQLDDLAP